MSSRRLRLIAAVAAIAAVIPLRATAEMRLVADKFLGFTPTAAAVDPLARKAFLLRHDHFDPSPRIKTVDLDTLVLGEIAVVSFPYQMVVDASRGLLYVTHQSPTTGEGMLSAVDTREGRVVGFKRFAAYPGAIVADLARRELYLASEWANSIWVVDADHVDVAQQIPLGEGFAAAGLGVDRLRDRIVVGNWLGSPIGVVDRSTRTLVARNAVSDESWLFDGGSESVVVDERRGLAYLMHTSGELSVLRAPDFRPALELADAWGVHYHSEQAALSLAWQSLYQVGHEWFGDGRRTGYALRSVDGGSGSKRIAALAGDDGFWARTLVVDDDGGDVYATAGKSSQMLLRIDPATLQVRETLATAGVVGELSFRDPVTGRIYIAGSQRLLAVEVKGAKTGTRIATGFHHDVFDHFFVTADPVERRLIDDGRYGSDWTVSDDLFRVWSDPAAGSVPVCRFVSARFAPKSSHVYTPHAAECEALQNDDAWQFEGIAFHVALPDTAGTCPVGTEPLYRLYNGGKGGAPNHRYTTSMQTLAALTANGWSAEGVGPGRVFACTPTLR